LQMVEAAQRMRRLGRQLVPAARVMVAWSGRATVLILIDQSGG
jgi:hypothetical protein